MTDWTDEIADAKLEQLAFEAANHADVPEWAQDTVKKLWKECCRRDAALRRALKDKQP